MGQTDGRYNYKGKEVTATCSVCGDPFTYFHQTGRPRVHCNGLCKTRAKVIHVTGKKRTFDPCEVSGCARLATRVGFGMCEAHYMRKRRSGSLQKKQPAPFRSKEGYVFQTMPGHPLANNGVLAVHRKVAYDTHGPDCPNCFWCAKQITWRACHIDHLNGAKDDNAPDNLVVSCPQCNRMRGACWPFLKGLSLDKRSLLIALLDGEPL